MAKGQTTTLHPSFRDLSGQRFGRLVAIRVMGSRNGKCVWLCRCDCNRRVEVLSSDLTRNDSRQTKSCGCQKHDSSSARMRRINRRHGQYGTPTYVVWQAMISRCHKKSDGSYHNYGGRGIRVCTEWRQSFEAFLRDMGAKPGPGYSIDREDTDGNYEPGNCRWATAKEQGRNKRNNVRLTLNGVTRCLTEWAEIIGVHHATIQYRLRRGLTVEQALTTPSRKGLHMRHWRDL